jgi:hypothetical protein
MGRVIDAVYKPVDNGEFVGNVSMVKPSKAGVGS